MILAIWLVALSYRGKWMNVPQTQVRTMYTNYVFVTVIIVLKYRVIADLHKHAYLGTYPKPQVAYRRGSVGDALEAGVVGIVGDCLQLLAT